LSFAVRQKGRARWVDANYFVVRLKEVQGRLKRRCSLQEKEKASGRKGSTRPPWKERVGDTWGRVCFGTERGRKRKSLYLQLEFI